MFDSYKKKLERLNADVPKIFENAQKKGILFFEKKAKNLSDDLIYNQKQEEGNNYKRTGNYKRNWGADKFKILGKYAITFFNNVEYASHLEWGHKIGKTERKTKGLFIGKQSVDDTIYEIVKIFDNELEKAIRKQ